jgi:hypothetical protein
VAGAEDLIPGLEPRDVRADRLDPAGDILTADPRLGRTESGDRAEHQRHARHEVPVPDEDAGREHAQEHAVVTDLRRVDVTELQDVGRSVSVLDDCLHGASRSGGQMWWRCRALPS